MTVNWESIMDDMDFEEGVLTDVSLSESHVELHWNSMGFGYERSLAPDFIPTAGMKTKLWGSIGRPVRGLMIEDRVIYYRTPAEEDERHRQWVEDKNRKDAERYEQDRTSNDERIAKLPSVFQERIREFRAYKPTWGRDFEGYELFVCEEAVKFATRLGNAEALKEFHAATWERQKEIIPDLGEGHSGNTFGAACSLAGLYLTNPGLIPKMHGALCALVGCDDYGCYAARSEVAIH